MDSRQNKLAFVTGVSSGIGEALVNTLLEKNYSVVGLGRKSSITHPNFSFYQIDLSDTSRLENFTFDAYDANEIVLVNNAGIIGDIAPVGDLKSNSIKEIITTNVIALQILCNKFIHQFLTKTPHLHIVNISSGAGKRPIDAWATYCSSKVAVDLFSQTIQEEMKARNSQNFFIHAVAPGIVDTNMQVQIRAASPDKFLASQRFHDIKNNNELSSPVSVAQRLFELIKNPAKNENCIISLSDIKC